MDSIDTRVMSGTHEIAGTKYSWKAYEAGTIDPQFGMQGLSASKTNIILPNPKKVVLKLSDGRRDYALQSQPYRMEMPERLKFMYANGQEVQLNKFGLDKPVGSIIETIIGYENFKAGNP